MALQFHEILYAPYCPYWLSHWPYSNRKRRKTNSERDLRAKRQESTRGELILLASTTPLPGGETGRRTGLKIPCENRCFPRKSLFR